jgi:putative nucleotidyltransferase with HDIG domain
LPASIFVVLTQMYFILVQKIKQLSLYLIAVSERRKSLIRIGLLLFFVLITTFTLPQPSVMEYSYEIGRPWTSENLIAPFDFAREKPEEVFRAEVKSRNESVPEVFLLKPEVSEIALNNTRQYLLRLQDALTEYRNARISGDKGKINKAEEALDQLNPGVDADEIAREDLEKAVISKVVSEGLQVLDDIYKRGVISHLKGDISSQTLSLRLSASRESIVSRDEVYDIEEAGQVLNEAKSRLVFGQIYYPVWVRELKVNYLFDDDLYNQDKEMAKRSVLRNYGKIRKGELIVSRGQIVTEEIHIAISSLVRAKQGSLITFNQGAIWLGKFISLSILCVLLIIFLRSHRSRVFYRNRKLTLILLVMYLMTLLAVLAVGINYKVSYAINYLYLAPVCMGPILVTVFFDGRLGIFINVMVSLVIGMIAPNSYEFVFIQIVGGTAAVYTLQKLRSRSTILITASWIFMTYTLAFLAYNLLLKGNFESIDYANIILLFLNALLTIITYPLIYIFEKIFGLTSDLTFIELLDTNHPLLKELSAKAPGTFQHSLQVANLAESVVDQIGGNGLKTRVGALFHDIGKMVNPMYFIENQMPGQNPHDALAPDRSAEIIIQHVTEGLRLAREHNLPSEIMDFIRTHHGTSRVEYFYRNHLRQTRELKDDIDFNFRYKGPAPSTRETAVLMVADSVEAASRALPNPTKAELEKLVDSIIRHKIDEQQFEKAGISFNDVRRMREILTKMLISIYHQRVEYPKSQTKPEVIGD